MLHSPADREHGDCSDTKVGAVNCTTYGYTAGHRMSDSSVIFEPVSKVMATALAAGMASATCVGEVDQHEIGRTHEARLRGRSSKTTGGPPPGNPTYRPL